MILIHHSMTFSTIINSVCRKLMTALRMIQHFSIHSQPNVHEQFMNNSFYTFIRFVKFGKSSLWTG